ncbi:MAG: hypothetical protein AAF750_03705 [Planctomycetota bacterium]
MSDTSPPPRDTHSPSNSDAELHEWELLAPLAQQRLHRLLEEQISDEGPDHGGFLEDPGHFPDGREAGLRAGELLALRLFSDRLGLNEQNAAIEDATSKALRFAHTRQRDDGQFDLGGAYSPNEAGFVIPGLVKGWRALQLADPRLMERFSAPIESIVRTAAEAVVAGDAYSANHRWAAACAPLALAHHAFPDPRYPAKIEDYLADGIDCDADGFWYEERSPNYNGVANGGMLALADELGRDDLLDHVVRNLRLMIELTQPDGSADTSTSFRQDRHAVDRRPASYRAARRAALHSGDGHLTTFAQQLLHRHGVGRFTELLYDLDRHPGPLPPALPISTQSHRHFSERQIVRHRHESWAVTLAADAGGHYFDTVAPPRPEVTARSTDWLCLHCGKVQLPTLRLAIAGAGVFAPSRLTPIGHQRYRLTDERSGFTLHQHFRPGEPTIHRDLPMSIHAELALDEDRLTLELTANARGSVYASLVIYVGHHATVEGHTIPAGQAIEHTGDGPITFTSGTDRLILEGLPPSLHSQPLSARPHIPDVLDTHAGRLVVGLRLPVRLSLVFRRA